MSTGYVYDQSWQEERARIAGMEALWDPGTIDVLEALSLPDEPRCLEVGAGGGTIVEWMAARGGRVTATDIDTRFVQPLASDRVEVLRHDVTADPLPEAEFDLVHARLVLEHLPGRRDVVAKLVSSLRPGGWLVVEDYDWTGFGITPIVEVGERTTAAILGFMERAGFDQRYGRRVVDDVAAAGLADVRGEGRALSIPSDHPGFAFFRLSLMALRDAIVGAGDLSAEDADGAVGLMDRPDVRVLTPLMMAAIGRRPG